MPQPFHVQDRRSDIFVLSYPQVTDAGQPPGIEIFFINPMTLSELAVWEENPSKMQDTCDSF